MTSKEVESVIKTSQPKNKPLAWRGQWSGFGFLTTPILFQDFFMCLSKGHSSCVVSHKDLISFFFLHSTLMCTVSIHSQRGKPFWLLDLSPKIVISSLCWRPLGFVTNFPLVPNTTTDYTWKPMHVTYQSRLLWPGVPIACFDLSPVITILAELNITSFVNCMTLASPCSFAYLNIICSPVSKEIHIDSLFRVFRRLL